MTPYRVAYTRRSATDLVRITNRIAADSARAAAGWAADMVDAIGRLADTPHRGVVDGRPGIGGNPVRSLAVGSYVVYFRAVDRTRTVRVLRVRHGARRPLRRYG